MTSVCGVRMQAPWVFEVSGENNSDDSCVARPPCGVIR